MVDILIPGKDDRHPLFKKIEQQYKNAQHLRRPSGHILIDGIMVADTRRCSHCGGHYISIKGSGIRRGFCWYCMGETCGSINCDKCEPLEKKLLAIEKADKERRSRLEG